MAWLLSCYIMGWERAIEGSCGLQAAGVGATNSTRSEEVLRGDRGSYACGPQSRKPVKRGSSSWIAAALTLHHQSS